jgi:hypothetical protein
MVYPASYQITLLTANFSENVTGRVLVGIRKIASPSRHVEHLMMMTPNKSELVTEK